MFKSFPAGSVIKTLYHKMLHMVTIIPPRAIPAGTDGRLKPGFLAVDALVEEMGANWRGVLPPMEGLAHFAIEGRTFMRIRDGYRSEFLDGILPGSVLMDLGAGFCSPMMLFARTYGVGKYVAVDRYCTYPEQSNDPRIEFVNDDMLRFLILQPAGSGNIVANAIDEIILSSGNSRTDRFYLELLALQMARVVPNGGIAFGFNSIILDVLPEYGFSPVTLNEQYGVAGGTCMVRRECS